MLENFLLWAIQKIYISIYIFLCTFCYLLTSTYSYTMNLFNCLGVGINVYISIYIFFLCGGLYSFLYIHLKDVCVCVCVVHIKKLVKLCNFAFSVK